MDIEKLRLTEQEKLPFVWEINEGGDPIDRVADAQLAKLGWGMVDWINLQLDIAYGAESATHLLLTMRNELTEALESAGVTRPQRETAA